MSDSTTDSGGTADRNRVNKRKRANKENKADKDISSDLFCYNSFEDLFQNGELAKGADSGDEDGGEADSGGPRTLIPDIEKADEEGISVSITQPSLLEKSTRKVWGLLGGELSENTRQNYRSGWRDFKDYCRQISRQVSGGEISYLPAEADTVVRYIANRAYTPENARTSEDADDKAERSGLLVPTLEQRLAAISYFHTKYGHPDPTDHTKVERLIDAIRRCQKHRSDGAKPFTTEQIKLLVDSLPKKTSIYQQRKEARNHSPSAARLTETEKRRLALQQKRDRAILLIGFTAALRRSEISGLWMKHLTERDLGLVVEIPFSKTDKTGQGQRVHVKRLASVYDPIGAIKDWVESAGIEKGPVFRPVTPSGEVTRKKPRSENALSGQAIHEIISDAVRLAMLDDPGDYSPHSLRAGHATEAAKNGADAEIAMNTTRHSSIDQFANYVRNDEEAFKASTSGRLGL